MENLTITLAIEDINTILQVLQQLPNSSGTFPTLVRVQEIVNTAAQAAQTEVKVDDDDAVKDGSEIATDAIDGE